MRRMLAYIRYFFYLAWNWNPVLAAFVLRHELRGEKKYGLQTTGSDDLASLKEKGVDTSHATMYQPLNYFMLETMLAQAPKYQVNKTFLDMGCGKGRVMAVAAFYGYERISGIDFNPDFCEAAKETTDRCKKKFPDVQFTVINNDAFYYHLPKDLQTIFLFNPFDEVIMSGVVSNIVKSQRAHPRTIRVLYANPMYKSLFLSAGFVETFYLRKMTYLEGSILEKKM